LFTALNDPALAQHLAELRQRIIISALSLLVGFGLALWWATPLIQALKHLSPTSVQFVQLAPGEALMASLKVMLVVGFGLSSPVVLYQAVRFVQPGLHAHEKRWGLWLVVLGSLLFAGGVLFAYAWVLPPTLTWLTDYGQDLATMQLSITRYVDFCLLLLLLTGVMFELPMVLFGLAMAGLVTSHKLLAQWRTAVVGIFVASAILTPSQDPLSMVAVGGAMAILYMLSIIPIRLAGK
jgi:sec-independent protein translocase protein TatC